MISPEDFSEEFFKILAQSAEFGGFAADDLALRDRIARLTAYGQSAAAISLVLVNSDLSEKEAQDLVQRIECASDRVFYATGLRPSLRNALGPGGNRQCGTKPQ